MRAMPLALFLLVASTVHSQPVSAPEREANLFGTSSVNPSPDTEGDGQGKKKGSAREITLFGETAAPSAERRLAITLAEQADPLSIGGRAYFRSSTEFSDNAQIDEVPLGHSAQLYLYGDARPTSRLRVYVKTRIDHDFSEPTAVFPLDGQTRERTRINLDQLWLKFDIKRKLFLTIGQQPIRWGTGRIWNPTDFVNAQRKDPLAIFDARPGVPLIKLHLPIESTGTNLYAVAQMDDVSTISDVGGVLRAEQTLGESSEFSTTVAARKEQPLRLGIDYSVGIGPVELRLEGSVSNGGDLHRWTGKLVTDPTMLSFPERESASWSKQAGAGFEWGIAYGDLDSLYLTVEYFHNDLGYNDSSVYPWLLVQGDFAPLYVGRHYIATNLTLPRPGSWNDTTFLATGILNLSDDTGIIRLDYQTRVLTKLTVFCYIAGHIGDQGEFRFGLDVPQNNQIPGLENGFTISPPWIDLGIWLALDI
jgi:hypothetical protein